MIDFGPVLDWFLPVLKPANFLGNRTKYLTDFQFKQSNQPTLSNFQNYVVNQLNA